MTQSVHYVELYKSSKKTTATNSQISVLKDRCWERTAKAQLSSPETLWVQTYFERLQEIGISQLHSIGPFAAFCIPEIAPEGFPVIILYLQHIINTT